MTLTTTETAVDAKVACLEEDEQFYFVTSEYRDQTNVLALAANVEADTRLYFVALADQNILTALVDSPADSFGLLKNSSYERTHGLFSDEATTSYPELAEIGKFTTTEVGTIDWYAKSIGVSASKNPATGKNLSSTHQNYLISRNASAIVPEGGVNILKMGYTFSGHKIGEIHFRDFYASRLKEGFQSWRINKNKIPYDQTGIDSAESVFRSVTERYVSTQDRPHAIQSYVTNFPRREDVSFNDIANNVLNASATIYLTGSIFTVVLDGVLTYDAEF